MKLKVCVFTGSRAEYGLLKPLLRLLKADSDVKLQLLVSGMHLSPEFGLSYQQIKTDGFKIDEKVEMLLSADTDTSIVKSTGIGMMGYAAAFERLKPDWVVILGDRFEAFAATSAAYLMKTPIAHLHGGEITEGATDDALRHAITKMSYLHFTSLTEYRNRVIQLGENPKRVFNVGAIGLDNIKRKELLTRRKLEDALDLGLMENIILVTYHPVTLEHFTAAAQMDALFEALDYFPYHQIIFTLPNADANGRVIIDKIQEYQENSRLVSVFTNLGSLRYLSLLQFVTMVVGNSSSGIIEAPSFGIPTVNIGDRQKGRTKANTVIDVAPEADAISAALKKAEMPEFRKWCKKQSNPYGQGKTAEKVLRTLKQFGKIDSIKKAFYDNPNS